MNSVDLFACGRTLESEAKGILQAKLRAFELAEQAVSHLGERVDGGGGNRVEDRYATLAELSQQLDRKLYDLYSAQSRLLEIIGQLADGRHRALLIERYINCLSWEEVSQQLGYSLRQTMRINEEALAAAQHVIESRTRNVV